MTEKIARYYVESENPMGGSFPGVPLRDLTESEWEALPKWLQDSVDAAPFYRKTAIREADKKGAAKADNP